MARPRCVSESGAARVVVSLWSVNDEGTAELMVRFYRKLLREKMRPAAALSALQARYDQQLVPLEG